MTMEVIYHFVPYGEVLVPEKDTFALDVGMKTVPGVIDHHHPEAEPECTASLLVKHPELIFNHLDPAEFARRRPQERRIKIITHRLPDFDAVASIFICLKLLETGQVDPYLEEIAVYTRMVDSASLPKSLDLTATPYSILRAIFASLKKEGDEGNFERIEEGLRLMHFLYTKSEEGYDIIDNRTLFAAVDRYEKAMKRVEEDYFQYLLELEKFPKLSLYLPSVSGDKKILVDGLICRNPKSFLLREWARRDRNNSPHGEGFGFLLTAFGHHRYILGVDPDRGVNLKGLGDLLNQKEEEKRKSLNRPMTYRWYDGNCPFFNYRIIDSPQDGPALSFQEIVRLVIQFGSSK
ncbi:MAG: hypothetical protein N3B16_10200 [Candidatus Aminicenantes bacterium]|nr:hypothetical protein [Candidatus Aminicenantes bacterium]